MYFLCTSLHDKYFSTWENFAGIKIGELAACIAKKWQVKLANGLLFVKSTNFALQNFPV